MIHQLSLFAEEEREQQWKFADRICEEFNKLDTVFKGKFFVAGCSLRLWTHVPKKNKTLEVSISAHGVSSYNSFMQFEGDRQSQLNINNIAELSRYVGKLCEDKDFSLIVTPRQIYIFYDNFELKKIEL